MIRPKVSAEDGSVAIGGDNSAPIINVAASDGSTVNVNVERQIARELPSFLANVIVLFSQQSLSKYGVGARRELPPEVVKKVEYNNLPNDHHVLRDYRRHCLVLEMAYRGAEQQNDDSRYLVRRRAAIAYQSKLDTTSKSASIPITEKSTFARNNATMLVEAVIDQLLLDYKSSKAILVEQETAHLAISLVVADAVVECEVLERPQNAITS